MPITPLLLLLCASCVLRMKYKKIWVDKVIYIAPKGKGAAATAIRLSSFKEKKTQFIGIKAGDPTNVNKIDFKDSLYGRIIKNKNSLVSL